MRSSIASWSAAACSRLMGRHTEPNTSGLTIPPRNPHLLRWPEFPENARQNFRNPHFEFLVGVMLTYYVFFPTFSYAALTVVEGIQIIGGLYVMVRGLDNVSKGVEGTRFEQSWKKLFG